MWEQRGKFIPAASSNLGLEASENLLNREFHAGWEGEKRGPGLTCLRTSGGWFCLTVALGLFDRKMIGRALSAGMETAHTAIPALQTAFASRTAHENPLFHSGRGAQYCALSFRDILHAYGSTIRQSMSRKGNCQAFACAESFFKTLKRELETPDGKHSAAEVRQPVFMYVEAYYLILSANRGKVHASSGPPQSSFPRYRVVFSSGSTAPSDQGITFPRYSKS
jgi:transposase InsO family protein